MTTDEGAKEISNYLMLGMHHSTPQAQEVIRNIISDIRASVAIEWFHLKNETEIKLLEMLEERKHDGFERDLLDY